MPEVAFLVDEHGERRACGPRRNERPDAVHILGHATTALGHYRKLALQSPELGATVQGLILELRSGSG
jgi:hypothetical protein